MCPDENPTLPAGAHGPQMFLTIKGEAKVCFASGKQGYFIGQHFSQQAIVAIDTSECAPSPIAMNYAEIVFQAPFVGKEKVVDGNDPDKKIGD